MLGRGNLGPILAFSPVSQRSVLRLCCSFGGALCCGPSERTQLDWIGLEQTPRQRPRRRKHVAGGDASPIVPFVYAVAAPEKRPLLCRRGGGLRPKQRHKGALRASASCLL